MGFLSDLVEDVIEAAEKTVKSPLRLACEMNGQHSWVMYSSTKRKCEVCGATEPSP